VNGNETVKNDQTIFTTANNVSVACAVGDLYIPLSTIMIAAGSGGDPESANLFSEAIVLGTQVFNTSAAFTVNITDVEDGASVTAGCMVKNQGDLTTLDWINVATVDRSAPLPPSTPLTCTPSVVMMSGQFTCTWGPFSDPDSVIAQTVIRMGTSKGGSEIVSEVSIPDQLFTFDSLFYDMTTVAPAYEITVAAINAVGLRTEVYYTVLIDTTPPTTNGSGVSFVADAVINQSSDDFAATDCQTATNRVTIQWSQFIDEESGIDHYEVAVATNSTSTAGIPTGGFLISWQKYGNTTLFADLALPDPVAYGTQLYALLTVYNSAGLTTTINSPAVGIVNQGPTDGQVSFGLRHNASVSYQLEANNLTFSWSFQHPCQIVKYRWLIRRELSSAPVFGPNTTTFEYGQIFNVGLQANTSYVVEVTGRRIRDSADGGHDTMNFCIYHSLQFAGNVQYPAGNVQLHSNHMVTSPRRSVADWHALELPRTYVYM
jgi:hypothetical protein